MGELEMPDLDRTDQSRIYLPLRTSVDLFSDPGQPSPQTRAKQAAVLYDVVIVEMGFLDVNVTEHGSAAWWTPPEQIRPDQIARARQPPGKGAPFAVGFGVEREPGVPAEEMHTAFAGPLSMSYGAEWHSEVLVPLEEIGVDFVAPLMIGGGGLPPGTDVRTAIDRLNNNAWRADSLMEGRNTFERKFIYESFNQDSAVARDLDAAVQVSTLYEPMLEYHGWQPTGASALAMTVPNLGSLDWEQILAFREHPGGGEARAMLRDAEQQAANAEPEDAREFLNKTFGAITASLFCVIEDRSVDPARRISTDIAKDAISIFLPPLGVPVAVANTLQNAATVRAQERSGVAALMKLRQDNS